ncbi:MAG: thioredoxin family protein [Candidatus Omnitrophica bacterium]|nr:thioredoxin family protein [Candidatus Omnitrophota bacterium]
MISICTILLAALLAASNGYGDSVGSSEHVEAELISEVSSIKPGEPFWVGVRLTMAPEWHTYWQNPGDAGLPTRITWNLPEGFEAGPIQWPFPVRVEIPPLVDFGYENEIILLSEITPPSVVNSPVTIGAKIDWLECKDICIPGQAKLDIILPVKTESPALDLSRVELFKDAQNRLPLEKSSWQIKSYHKNEKIAISMISPPGYSNRPSEVMFFPLDEAVIELSTPQELRATLGGFVLFLQKSSLANELPPILKGVLVSDVGWADGENRQAIAVGVPLESVPDGVTWGFNWGVEAKSRDASQIASSLPRKRGPSNTLDSRFRGNDSGLWLALVFAFLGGLLLNLMPCVLPVLSIKILGFVKQAGEDPLAVRIHGLLFGFGVLVSFWVLSLALLALRAGGAQFGWGFQLQSPAFVSALACLFFLLALNLFGFFEWGGSFARAGQIASRWSGFTNSFLNGALATVIATPCTAPFMGAAVGFGLSQPQWVSFLVFTSLALGMASPYVILAGNPRLLQFVPKPGPWMVVLKRVMALPLLGTVVWLAWVLHLQIGRYAYFVLPAAMVFLIAGISSFLPRICHSRESGNPVQGDLLHLVGLALLALGFAWAAVSASWSEALYSSIPRPIAIESRSDGIVWETFSPERLAELRRENKPVFIDFTAAWCLTCQVNERITFRSKEVQEKFREAGVVAMKADWTRRDETVSNALAGYGRSGVPLYVLYGPGRGEPVILPEVITAKMVLDALDPNSRE